MPENKRKTEDSSEIIKERTELSLLFDFYSELLDEHKKEVFGEYIMNDLSLAEISEGEGISRQGVHDIVKRTAKQLREYENRLGLLDKYRKLQGYSNELDILSYSLKSAGYEKEAMVLHRIAGSIGETL